MTKRLIAFLLVLSLVLLPACDSKKEKTVAENFRSKVESLNKQDDLQMKMNMTAQKTVGTYSYEESFETKANYADRNSKKPIAKVTTKETIDGQTLKYVDQYAGGKGYMEIDGDFYVCEESFKDYMAHQQTYVLLNPDNYKSVTYDKKTSTFTFKDPTKAEGFLATDITVLHGAEGSAKVNKSGKITSMTYTVQYTQGPVTVDAAYEVTFSASGLKKDDLDVEEDAIETVDLSIPYFLNRSETAMKAEAPVSGTQYSIIMSQLLGCYSYIYTQMDSYDDGENPMAKIETNVQVEDASEEVTMEASYTFKDGKSSMTMDGETIEAEEKSFEEFQEQIWEKLQEGELTAEMMTNMTITPVSDYWLIEYELTEEGAEAVQGYVSATLLGSESMLSMYVDELKTGTMEGWLSVDMDTLLPVSTGLNVEMTQVAQGYDCLMTVELVNNMEFGDPDAYEAVTEEPLSQGEPENKPTPLLYEVTDDNGGKMYLFGTIHVGDDATAYLPDYVTNALKASDYLGMEMDVDSLEDRMDEDEAIVNSYWEGMIYQDGSFTKDKLDEETAKAVNQLIRAIGKLPYMEYYLPAALDSYFGYNAIDAVNGLSQSKGVEERLTKLAKENQIPIIEIEDVHEHLKLYGRYSDETQKIIMENSLEVYRVPTQERLLEMYTTWCKGDEKALTDMIREDDTADEDMTEEELAAFEEYNQYLTVERDAIMLEKAKEYIASGDTVFFAVGCAHVLGETGLVDSLRAAGYTVTLISQ